MSARTGKLAWEALWLWASFFRVLAAEVAKRRLWNRLAGIVKTSSPDCAGRKPLAAPDP